MGNIKLHKCTKKNKIIYLFFRCRVKEEDDDDSGDIHPHPPAYSREMKPPHHGNIIQGQMRVHPHQKGSRGSGVGMSHGPAASRTPSSDRLEISETECDRERQIVPPPRSYSDAKYNNQNKSGNAKLALDYSIAV